MKANSKSTLLESEKRIIDSVLGLVLYTVGVVLLAIGFTYYLSLLLPRIGYAGSEIVIGAIVIGLSVAVFKSRI
ncbi:MAG: hypothetical protein M1433_02205 [Candidatus Parvarchaeota archaeon]|jgi:hypothetical protein|nr:hypothetical protein [Candidatus Parvarchaeota archaeon]